MDKNFLKEIIINQRQNFQASIPGIIREKLIKIETFLNLPHTIIISGLRRSGKSTLLRQITHHYFKDQDYYYLSFEDERLLNFSVENFNDLYEIFIELYGDKKVFCFDEIQNIDRWENFVRRMQDTGTKFIITGSNSSLLSKELGSKLTGRHIVTTLFPFSFQEYLTFKDIFVTDKSFYITGEKVQLKKEFLIYLQNGGIPEFIKYQDQIILKKIYEDILFRDILTRYEIKDLKTFRELAFYLLTNTTQLFSYNKLKNLFQVGSVNTIKNYVEYLENSYLFFTLNKFSFSLKEQAIANKKIYCIDNGFIETLGFNFSKNTGKYLENLVFLNLKKAEKEIYYYKTANNLEVDFLIKEKDEYHLIQVSETIINPDTRNRELRALFTAMQEVKIKKALLLTLDEEETILEKDLEILVMPVYRWVLEK